VHSERGSGQAHAVSMDRRASNRFSITDINISLCHAFALVELVQSSTNLDELNMLLQQHVAQQMPQLSHLQQLLHPAVTTLEFHFTP
jgi:hypothetical protein